MPSTTEPEGVDKISRLLGSLDYFLRGAIELFRSYGHEEAAKTLEEYREKVWDEFNRLEARPS